MIKDANFELFEQCHFRTNPDIISFYSSQLADHQTVTNKQFI